MKKGTETEMELDAVGMTDTPEEAEESPSSVYEVGYHLLPTLSEEALQSAVSELNELFSKNGATEVGSHPPSRIPLAYTLTKRIAGKIMRFDEAYFGWIAFEAPRETAAKITAALDAHPSVLRYILIRTSRDAVAAALSGAVAAVPVIGNIERPKRENEAGGEVSDVALNQALESMATEDAKVAE